MRQTLINQLYQRTKPRLLQNLRELEEIQWRSGAAVRLLQRQQLQLLLDYVNIHVPYYRELFQQIGFQPDDFRHDPTTFEQIPPLTKQTVREQKERLLSTDPQRQASLGWQKTGGTTGEPLWFGQDQRYRDTNIAHDYHVMTWSGWQLGQPQFWLWGHVPDSGPTGLKLRLRQAKDALLNRFDSNAFIMSAESLGQLVKHIQTHRHGILWSYVSTAYRFAQFVEQSHIPAASLNLQAIYTAAEPLFEHQRSYIERVLGAPIFNCYSSIDVGDIACECDRHDGLHMTTRNCYTEIMRDGQVVPDGEEGEFILTNLTNYAMPMIRYKIEDWGRKSTRSCDCGRGLPLLEVVEGRKIDLFKTRDGRTVYGAFAKDLMPMFPSVKQFQVVQTSLDEVIFRIVKEGTAELDAVRLKGVEQVTKNALGEHVTVRFEFVDELPQTPTGKHRYLVSEVE